MRKKLVAYFSASGVTKAAAECLAKAVGADLFEIKPKIPYTRADLDWTNKKSRSSIEMSNPDSRPEITEKLSNMDEYDTVFIGFPIWWHTAPMLIGTFLEHYNWTAQDNIYPFFQGASNRNQEYYDNSMSFVSSSAAAATVHEGLYCDEGAAKTIDEYLSSNGLIG